MALKGLLLGWGDLSVGHALYACSHQSFFAQLCSLFKKSSSAQNVSVPTSISVCSLTDEGTRLNMFSIPFDLFNKVEISL